MNGLLLENIEVLTAMEKELSGKYVPVKLKIDGNFAASSSIASLTEFNKLKIYIENLLKQMGNDLYRGEISLNPYFDAVKDFTPCQWCEMRSLCGYEPGRIQMRHYKRPEKEKLWNEITRGGD